ncbi:MAG TPA: hypothetical protein VK081_00350 [Planctomycetota bacterium]|nr:hypothetical protein [Planctomycetota bacterium]
MPAEQLMERVADDAGRSRAPAQPAQEPQTSAVGNAADGSETTFSPDPQRRTDRYRLVTPYLLRL